LERAFDVMLTLEVSLYQGNGDKQFNSDKILNDISDLIDRLDNF